MTDMQKTDGAQDKQISELTNTLVTDIRNLIDSGKARVAQTVNQELVLLYWRIGVRIRQSVLHDARAEYGKQIMVTLASTLTLEYGRGFNGSALSRMVKLAEMFPSSEILATVSQELSWSH